MDAMEFLAAVLPKSGVYCVVELSSGKKEHVFGTLQELEPHIARFNEEKRNTYFALASFIEPGSRTAENALCMRSFFMDLDAAGRAFGSKKEAATALDAFIKKVGLPQPWLVDSGNGIHAYWPFDEDVAVLDWKGAAENLKRLCAQEKLAIDFTVTADAARILRVPGTFNYKPGKAPKEVTVKIVNGVNKFDDLQGIINTALNPANAAPPPSELNLAGQRLPASTTKSLITLLENRETYFKTILDKSIAGKGCSQLLYYANNATKDGMEPLWRGLLSIAKVCVDGDKAAKRISQMHPYTETRMQTKLREIKGPYPCTKFDSENPGVCPTCPSWGKITNPLTFGHEVVVDNAEKPVQILESSPAAAPVVVTRPLPPHGFSYGKTGGVYRSVSSVDDAGNPVVELKQILPYDMFVVDLLNDPELGHQVQLVAAKPDIAGGPTNILLPQRAVVSKDDLVKALAQQNVIASYGSGNDRYLFDFVRGAVEDASRSKRAIAVPQSYGWQDDGTFVYNSRIYSKKGEQYVPMTKLANVVARTQPKGTLDAWRRIVGVAIAKELHPMLSLLLVSFGSPLMRFVGSSYRGLAWHFGSTESGAGKTLTLNLAASVWGSAQYILHPNTSEVAQEHRQGYLGSLPLIIDEATEVSEDKKWIKKLLMMLSGGQGKERMKSGSNEERLNTTMWAAQQILASNGHIMDAFAGDEKSAQGHIRRILEFIGDKELAFTAEETEVIDTLADNYGVAGHAWAQWLVRNAPLAREVVRKVHYEIRAELSHTGGDRIWLAGISANLAACQLLSNTYSGIIELPYQAIKREYAARVEEGRATLRQNFRDAEDVLNSYTKEFYGNFVIVTKVENEFKTKFGREFSDETITRTQVKGRVERGFIKGCIAYFIEEQEMKKFCSKMRYGYADFKRNLMALAGFTVSISKKDLLKHAKGPQMRVNALHIIRPEAHDPSFGPDAPPVEEGTVPVAQDAA